MNEEYRIKLGTEVDLSDIQSQINTETGKVNPKIKVDVDAADLAKKVKSELEKVLGKSDTALKIDTTNIEKSLADVSGYIKDIKSAIGSLDSSKGMKSLLSSINQINSALENASNQFVELNSQLKSLGSKDFSLNFGINLGGNSFNNNATYGRVAKGETLPQLKSQYAQIAEYVKKVRNLEGDLDSVALNLAQKADSGMKNGLMKTNAIELLGVATTGSIQDSMAAYSKLISMMKKSASMQGIDLSPITSKFSQSADELVEDTLKIRTGERQMEESFEKLKNVFGGGIDSEKLSTQLDSIVTDLNEIKTAIQGLSSDNPIDVLTQSFDRLSTTLEKLTNNFASLKVNIDTGMSGAETVTSTATQIEKASDDATSAVIRNEKKKQEAYKATAEDVIYHAGIISKLNKAESNGRFVGGGRGTGYYGTGHYFVDSVTKRELDNSGSYSKLPYTSVDISQYDNLFKATSNEVASQLHQFLKNLTNFTMGSDAYDMSELFAQFKKVFGDTVMDVQEFGNRLDQLKSYMSKSMTDPSLGLSDRGDSVPTQFMKSLGYGGVDTRGTRYANTEFGTVIYDLKEESILQANITDELQKQGQMLEKINYEKGQVFDKDTDARIQAELDRQAMKKEVQDEFNKSYDSSSYDKAEDDLNNARKRLWEIEDVISECQSGIRNASEEARKFANEMDDFGLSISDEEIKDYESRYSDNLQNEINKLSQEKLDLESQIPNLEKAYKREAQLANEAMQQAKRVVEQRHLEAQQAQEAANAVVQSEEKKQQAAKETSEAFKKAANDVSKSDNLDIDVDDSELEDATVDLKKIKDLAKEIGNLDFKIKESSLNDEVNQVKEFQRQLDLAKTKWNAIISSIEGQGIDIGSISTEEFVKARNKIAELEASYKDARAELSKKIELNVSDTGKYTEKVRQLRREFDSLPSKTNESKIAINGLEQALKDMQMAANDDERIAAEERYQKALQDTKVQLDRNKQIEKDANKRQKLNDDILVFQSKIDAWMSKNSAATKQFGADLLDLKAKAEGCDRVTLNHLEKELKQIDNAAEKAGVKFKSFGDRLKDQFRTLSSYTSISSLFMYGEQALRDMFEQVKAIDSAMTELKKVTDETDASYSKFLSNAASRAKEIGTTIDGLVESTSDFARLGYGFEDAQGLAEVANIYAVVGDEVEGVEGATQSLISTMAAFKDEMNGLSNTDFSMSIIDKMNEVGKLIA